MIQKHLDLISLITDMRLEIKGKMFWQMVFEEIVKPQTQGKSKIEMNKRLVQDFELFAFAKIFKVSADVFNSEIH